MIFLNYFLGASIGSFFCLIYERTNKNLSIITPRSHCDYCGHVLGILDLIPSVSYLLFGRRCRYCHQKYNSHSFQVELYLGLSFLLLYFNFYWQVLIVELVLSYCYLTDLGEMKIFTWMPIILTLLLLPTQYLKVGESLILIFIVGTISLFTQGMGIGDLLLLFPISLVLGIEKALELILISCLLILALYWKISPKKKIAFVPYLTWGFLIIQILTLVSG
ncbi:prepilin peptidase [Xylocopilactobacillus apis]|nr:prepilin peptidase [Xylocopilactobacillus apis]